MARSVPLGPQTDDGGYETQSLNAFAKNMMGFLEWWGECDRVRVSRSSEGRGGCMLAKDLPASFCELCYVWLNKGVDVGYLHGGIRKKGVEVRARTRTFALNGKISAARRKRLHILSKSCTANVASGVAGAREMNNDNITYVSLSVTLPF